MSGLTSDWLLGWISGPMKLKRTSNTITASPTTASLLSKNSRSASVQPLAMTWTSPPSGPAAMEMPAMSPSPSISGAAGSVKAHPRVCDGDGDVGDQVSEHRQNGAEDHVGEQDVVVEGPERGVEQQPQARIVEKVLGE